MKGVLSWQEEYLEWYHRYESRQEGIETNELVEGEKQGVCW